MNWLQRIASGAVDKMLGRTTGRLDALADQTIWWPVSASGERVTPESARGLSAYYAAIRNISEDVGGMPIDIVHRAGERREPQPAHPLDTLLNVSPNPESTAIGFREAITACAMGWGNGWAEIVRDGRGEPIELWPIHPSRVTLKRTKNKTLVAEVAMDIGQTVPLAYRDIFHLHGLGDGLVGESVAVIGSESLGRGLAIQKHSGAVFASGTIDRLAIKHPKFPSEQARKNLRESWPKIYGGAGNTGVALLDEGMEPIKIGINPKDAQMIESAQFTVEDVARWLRCPLSKIQYFLRAQGWSTLEMLNTDYVVDTLSSWTLRWEQEIRRKLLTDSSLRAKHNFGSLLQGDNKSRAEFYRTMQRGGIYSVNEIRALEDMNPIGPEGDLRIVESNMQPLVAMLITDKPEPNGDSQQAVTDSELNFKREVAKALIADGTIGDIPIVEKRTGPHLPIVAATGILVSGEPDRPPTAGGPESDNGEPDRPPIPPPSSDIETVRALLEEAWQRVYAKEVSAARSAVRRYLQRDNPEGFEAWADRWFGAHVAIIVEIIGEPMRALAALEGSNLKDIWIDEVAERHIANRKGQLLACLHGSGMGAVVEQIHEWASTRTKG